MTETTQAKVPIQKTIIPATLLNFNDLTCDSPV